MASTRIKDLACRFESPRNQPADHSPAGSPCHACGASGCLPGSRGGKSTRSKRRCGASSGTCFAIFWLRPLSGPPQPLHWTAARELQQCREIGGCERFGGLSDRPASTKRHDDVRLVIDCQHALRHRPIGLLSRFAFRRCHLTYPDDGARPISPTRGRCALGVQRGRYWERDGRSPCEGPVERRSLR
jgi:hypothetical protein